MTSMTLLFIALIVAGVVLLIWRVLSAGAVQAEAGSAEDARAADSRRATALPRADLALTEFAEEWDVHEAPAARAAADAEQPAARAEADAEQPASRSTPASEQPASVHDSLQQIEETEASLSDSVFHSLQQQLTETASILQQVEQQVMALHALEPFRQQWQQVLQWQQQLDPDAEPNDGQSRYDI